LTVRFDEGDAVEHHVRYGVLRGAAGIADRLNTSSALVGSRCG
jgi:hypothetical protein